MINRFLLAIAICIAGTSHAQNMTPQVRRQNLSIGEYLEFESKVLNETRRVNVYLPLGYANNDTTDYPVIYLLDGSMDEDFIHIAGLVQFCSFSWINIIPESIVIGISNVDRKRDYTYPTNNKKDKKDFPTTGGSAAFMDFLETELQPMIQKMYRIDSTSTLIGQSLGGLMATEILFKKPDLFDNYIIISPSLWWDDESLLKLKMAEIRSNHSIYIGVGKEGEVMERVANELHTKLTNLNAAQLKLYFQFFEQNDHGDVLHIAVYNAFMQLYKKEK